MRKYKRLYCPLCKKLFTTRGISRHLLMTHKLSSSKIAKLTKKGFKTVPVKSKKKKSQTKSNGFFIFEWFEKG